MLCFLELAAFFCFMEPEIFTVSTLDRNGSFNLEIDDTNLAYSVQSDNILRYDTKDMDYVCEFNGKCVYYNIFCQDNKNMDCNIQFSISDNATPFHFDFKSKTNSVIEFFKLHRFSLGGIKLDGIENISNKSHPAILR
jgi:hypothetical protein